MHKMFHPMFGSTLAVAAISLCSISAATGAGDQASFDDGTMGGGSGVGVDLDKMREIDQAGDKPTGSTQMYQAMTAAGFGPEDGDQAGDAGEQTGQQDQGADAVEQPDAPEGDDGKAGEDA